MVERPLDDIWSDPSAILFFLTWLRVYPICVAVLTARMRVNVDWVREACATLVPNPATPHTFYFYARVLEVTISPATVSTTLGLPAILDHTYPSQPG